ncbi:MAG: hypothetical protein ACRYGP_10400 [Janthinobacterium lividum]
MARVLVPELGLEDLVLEDDLRAHKGLRMAALIEAAGATLQDARHGAKAEARARS